LKSAKFGDKVISSVESKLRSIPPNSSEDTVKNVIANMTPEEQRLIREIGKEEHADVLSKVGQDVINNLTKEKYYDMKPFVDYNYKIAKAELKFKPKLENFFLEFCTLNNI
jgi:hypothetical protein